MFRKMKDYYNPKIDYKMLYFLNPKLDTSKNYYETKNIYENNHDYLSEQGKWFTKLKKVYEYLLTSDLDIVKILEYAKKEFETTIDNDSMQKIQNEYLKISTSDSKYLATWFLQEIIFNKPLKNFSSELGILIFNAIIKKAGYIPMIFKSDNQKFINRIVQNKITTSSLRDILSIYEDLSIKYDKRYKHLSKNDVISMIQNNQDDWKNKYDIKKIWLYGSFVRNEENDFSDVDLYIEFKKAKNQEEMAFIKKHFVDLLERDVDILVEHKKYHHFSSNAIKEREVIFDDCE